MYGTIFYAWATTDASEETFLFYANFYDDDFSNCTSAKDLEVVSLAIGLYKIESSIAMISLLLVPPALCTLLSLTSGPRIILSRNQS